jgi:hypothetical protein
MIKILNKLVPAVATDSTIQNVYVQIRKVIKATHGEDSDVSRKSYNVMRFDQVKWRAARAKYNKKVFNNNNNKKQFDEMKVYSIMDSTKANISPDYVDLAIALQLASGGRISEILSYAEFKASPRKDHIVQTGILKSKDRSKITKPVIHFIVAEFLSMFGRLREN